MAIRLLDIYITREREKEIKEVLEDFPVLDIWHDRLSENEVVARVLINTEKTDPLLDALDERFSGEEAFRVVILSPEATLPRPEEPEEEGGQGAEENGGDSERIAIEELYQKMAKVSGMSRRFVVMTVLASFVAAVGLIQDDTAIIIGSMVIAPLLSPYMGLSLATTLADGKLARKAATSSIAGFLIAGAIGVAIGFFWEFDPGTPQIASRSAVSHYYIFLALATGAAGAYSITTGVSEALVGVMVAVALLPPLVASALLFGAGYVVEAFGSLLLFLVNVVSVNLSGVVTLIAQGIRPKKWWEAKKARKAIAAAVFLWVVLLGVLAVLIYLEQRILAAGG